MEVHNVPEASDTNTFAEKGKSETFTEYHGISRLGVGKRVGNYLVEGRKFFAKSKSLQGIERCLNLIRHFWLQKATYQVGVEG